MKRKILKQMLSFVLVLVMVTGMLPMTTLAAVNDVVAIKSTAYMATWTDGDGGSYEKTFEYGEVITIPTNEFFEETFRKTGYTLTGWQGYTEGMTMPLNGVTFTAVYAPNNYTVSFDANGGEPLDPITVTYGERYGNLPSSAITGLSGGNSNWYLVDQYGNVTDTNIKKLTKVSVAGNHTLFMKRSVLAPNVSVVLTVPGGISDGYQYYIPGASERVLTATVGNMNTDILDYTYQWYKDGNIIADATAATLTLDGNVSDSGTYTVNVTAKLKDESVIIVTSDTQSAEKSQVVKILHAANTLYYDANGGEGGPSNSFTGGTTISVSSDAPTCSGYNFDGWNTKADGTGDKYTASSTYTFADDNGNGGCEVTLYAKWDYIYNSDVLAVHDAYNMLKTAISSNSMSSLKTAADGFTAVLETFNEFSEEQHAELANLMGVSSEDAFFAILSDWIDANVVLETEKLYQAYLDDQNVKTALDFAEYYDLLCEDESYKELVKGFIPDIDEVYDNAKEDLPSEDVIKVYDAYNNVKEAMVSYTVSALNEAVEEFEAVLDIYNELSEEQFAQFATLLGMTEEDAFNEVFSDWYEAYITYTISGYYQDYLDNPNVKTALDFTEYYDMLFNDPESEDPDLNDIIRSFLFDIDDVYIQALTNLPSDDVKKVYDAYRTLSDTLYSYTISELKTAAEGFMEVLDTYNEFGEDEFDHLATLLEVPSDEVFDNILTNWSYANIVLEVEKLYQAYLGNPNETTASEFTEYYDVIFNDPENSDETLRDIVLSYIFDIEEVYNEAVTKLTPAYDKGDNDSEKDESNKQPVKDDKEEADSEDKKEDTDSKVEKTEKKPPKEEQKDSVSNDDKQDSSEDEKTAIPQTGEKSKLMFWFLMLVISGGLLITGTFICKKIKIN